MVIYDEAVSDHKSVNVRREVQMIAMTWVELLLTGLLVASIAFSVGFCVSNYAKADKEGMGFFKKATK